jgi:hypothetical protein
MPGAGRAGPDSTSPGLMRARCADFMVPRYVEFLEELPRTEATQKVKKSELRAERTRLPYWPLLASPPMILDAVRLAAGGAIHRTVRREGLESRTRGLRVRC